MALVIAGKASTTPAEQVIDQGPEWVFHVTSQGEDGGAFTTSRNELRRAGWRVRVPSAVVAQLRAAEAPPTP